MKRFIVYLGTILFIFSKLTTSISAEPSASVYGVNDKTKECTTFSMGDECSTCTVPKDWRVSGQGDCPAGYKQNQKSADCTPEKTSFCCSSKHSGMMGDCEDVIVNNVNKECAFVSDINKCANLPNNWSRADEIEIWGRICPSYEYNWKDNFVVCNTKSVLPQRTKLLGLLIVVIIAFLGAAKLTKFRKK